MKDDLQDMTQKPSIVVAMRRKKRKPKKAGGSNGR